jgi:hypothetical protein
MKPIADKHLADAIPPRPADARGAGNAEKATFNHIYFT